MDEHEFDAFYTASFARLAGQLTAMIGDADEAHECVQEAFVRAWSHRRRLGPGGHPEAWVRTTAYRLAVSRWRRTVRGRRAPDRALASPTMTAGPTETRVALLAALQRLPESQRRAVVLHHLADLSVAEVAAETGAPIGTVKARLARGRAALAALIDDPRDHAEGTQHV